MSTISHMIGGLQESPENVVVVKNGNWRNQIVVDAAVYSHRHFLVIICS